MPGQSTFNSILIILFSLLFPSSGILRGIHAIRSRAIFADTELQTAARSGALCMVIEDQEAPEEPELVTFMATKIHGRIKLPRGWGLATVPSDATFENDEPTNNTLWGTFMQLFKRDARRITKLSSNYSLVKAVVAIGQTIFASITIYRSRGDQINRFGYAAFGLTVAPYALMSLVNLIGNLICPEYSTMYIVENRALDNLLETITSPEMMASFVVEGTVGRLSESKATSSGEPI
ncbi:hypothetical protein TWF730_001762 [Orbilia blumenaviensis]|uniref:ABC transmembrane type-1 domain-containing protein n=1 Tax=Orbilia blumenaviensis TaxID=1796055 RepID=A0AAV9UDH4_9PEZI